MGWVRDRERPRVSDEETEEKTEGMGVVGGEWSYG